MPAAQFDITIEQGATYPLELELTNEDDTPLDLTGYQARLQVRATYAASQPIVALTSTPAAGITLDIPAGIVRVRVEAAATAALPVLKAGVYDLELQAPDGTVTRLLEGKARITPEVTR